MILGNLHEGEAFEDKKLYWRFALGKNISHRHYEGGWRAFEFVIIRYDKSTPDGGAHPIVFRFAFAFWLPFELI